MNIAIPIEFITPCFCRGADCSETGAPEIRPASIRGQLHWWFRAVDGTPQEEKDIFGSVRDGAKASRLVVRVKHDSIPEPVKWQTLPHKPESPAPKKAIAPGVKFELIISTRLGGLSTDPENDLEKKFTRALDAWLHFGALGLRATRGGGNFTWNDAPKTSDDYDSAIKKIVAGTRLCAALLNKSYPNAEAARYDITNTLEDGAFGETAPLGMASGRRRKTSPLRFRVVKFADGSFRIAAIWDGRKNVTGNTREDLLNAIRKLKEERKSIGVQLAASSLA